MRNGSTQATRYVGAAEKIIDMKLSLSQQLLGAFALAAVLSMGVVAPAAARDNQRSEHADKDKKHDKARANDRQDARRQQAARQPAPRPARPEERSVGKESVRP